jgi:hypothetical protein
MYPGEVASIQIRLSTDELVAAITDGHLIKCELVDWLIEPMPGWRGVVLRWRWRMWGRWFRSRRPPVLHLSASVRPEPE